MTTNDITPIANVIACWKDVELNCPHLMSPATQVLVRDTIKYLEKLEENNGVKS